MGKGRPQKYNRITSQQKFMLRRLIIKEKMSVKQAATSLGINYSTAKTIMFFYRKCPTQNMLSISPSIQSCQMSPPTASYIETMPLKKIQILHSVGGRCEIKSQSAYHQSTDSHNNEVKLQNSL